MDNKNQYFCNNKCFLSETCFRYLAISTSTDLYAGTKTGQIKGCKNYIEFILPKELESEKKPN
jgi:hypothetical protein